MKNRVREFRLEAGLSVVELAQKANTTRQTIHSIENQEEIKKVSGAIMFAIADALNRNVREVFLS
ncbi:MULTISPECIES: helix-turn-helix transcriptional regulator [Paenibacillus]|uniref:helix-turn-helix transcriptional regulator n=1 Tax=Paenibacillus TaxID=44249 RepID=UPI000B58C2B6|nr:MULTISPECIES: helix-turn-helix domain-containing protein [Paenibacillus]